MDKKRKHTQVVAQSRCEIPVSSSHDKAPFQVPQWGQHRLPELSVRLCTPSKISPGTNGLAKLHVGLLKVPLEHSTIQQLWGESSRAPENRREPLERRSAAFRRPSCAFPEPCSPQPVLQLLTLCPGERQSWEPGEPQSTLRNVPVQITSVIPCPQQLWSSPPLPNLPLSSHLLCSGSA